jgi:hypothetical protein
MIVCMCISVLYCILNPTQGERKVEGEKVIEKFMALLPFHPFHP